MKKLTANAPETQSPDLIADNIAHLKALFPELLTEGAEGVAVNLDVLKQLVGDRTLTDAEEKYGLNFQNRQRRRNIRPSPTSPKNACAGQGRRYGRSGKRRIPMS